MSRESMQVMAEVIDGYLNGKQQPKRVGFAVFVFPFGETKDGRVNYVSNASRADMLVAVREWLARAEGRVQPAPEGRQ